jgi:DNA replication protein DnaC
MGNTRNSFFTEMSQSATIRPTIITSNLTRRELFAALGNSIVDRARENGKSIEFNWPSFRTPTPTVTA